MLCRGASIFSFSRNLLRLRWRITSCGQGQYHCGAHRRRRQARKHFPRRLMGDAATFLLTTDRRFCHAFALPLAAAARHIISATNFSSGIDIARYPRARPAQHFHFAAPPVPRSSPEYYIALDFFRQLARHKAASFSPPISRLMPRLAR